MNAILNKDTLKSVVVSLVVMAAVYRIQFLRTNIIGA